MMVVLMIMDDKELLTSPKIRHQFDVASHCNRLPILAHFRPRRLHFHTTIDALEWFRDIPLKHLIVICLFVLQHVELTTAAVNLNLRRRVVMVGRRPFRFFRALRGLCGARSLILVTMVTVTLWLFPPPRWREIRGVVLSTQTTIPTVSSLPGNGLSTPYLSSSLPPPVMPQNISSTLLPQVLASTIRIVGGYLSQRPPMVGTGQGNLMFMYASMLGIADHAQMVPDYPADGELKKLFNITTLSRSPTYSVSVQESKACSFDDNLFSLSNRQKNLTVVGYLQSWRYFSAIKDRILQEFTFNDDLRSPALNFLRNISLHYKTSSDTNETLYIGVHIRRKDMLVNYNIIRGYTVANREYLAVAVNYFRTNFPARALIFVVCADDLDWAKQNFPMVDRNSFVTFSENRTAAQDMAILAACNHTIITVGTFGWWSGYLAGGRTIYYKNFPAPGTHIASLLKKEDYFPPDWIGF